jgi:hypothetical protein
MDTPSPDTPIATPPRGAPAHRRRERVTGPRRPVTTQEARELARDHAILTEQGFQQGYVVLQPSRWLWRCWLDLERFNTALQRVEAQTFLLLDNRQTDYGLHLAAFKAVLADYRATLRRLTYHAHTLASGRVKELEKLTQQVVGAWRDDPSPPARFNDPPPDDSPAADPSMAVPAGAAAPPPGPDLTTFFGPSLAEERAAARAGETG